MQLRCVSGGSLDRSDLRWDEEFVWKVQGSSVHGLRLMTSCVLQVVHSDKCQVRVADLARV